MRTTFSKELQIAVAAVRSAAHVTRAVQENLVTAATMQKQDRSPVTVADFASQAVVCAALADGFPHDPVVAEEDADDLRGDRQGSLRAAVTAQVRSVSDVVGEQQVLDLIDRGGAAPDQGTGRFWTLDPIDGTKGFLRHGQYAIALALIDQGQIVLGVLGCPNLPGPDEESCGVLMAAVLGAGARMWPLDGVGLSGSRLVRVSEVTDPAQARLCESVEAGHSDQSQSGRIARRLGVTAEPIRMDSQAKYASVARGEASIYLRMTRPDYREQIWDHAAGKIVVEEAGGIVTDMGGKPLDFSRGRRLEGNHGIVATNGRFHEIVLDAVDRVVGGSEQMNGNSSN